MENVLVSSDGIGFVELIETFGNDLTVVNAARVSFAKDSGLQTEVTPRDVKLINYLADHNHVSPFFHPQARFRIRIPIFVAREWFRHTVGFSRNEVSRRYVNTPPAFWIPRIDDLRKRSPNLKQGSCLESVSEAPVWREKIENATKVCADLYNEMIEDGNVAPEIARSVLPQSMYTEFIETGSIAAYARLCKLRISPDAQIEIREYAEAIRFLLQRRFPVSWTALSK